MVEDTKAVKAILDADGYNYDEAVIAKYYNGFFKYIYHITVYNNNAYIREMLRGGYSPHCPDYILIDDTFIDMLGGQINPVTQMDNLYVVFKENCAIEFYSTYPTDDYEENSNGVQHRHKVVKTLMIYADDISVAQYYADLLKKCNVYNNPNKNIIYSYIFSASNGGFNYRPFSLTSNYNVDINKNFNDDFPNEEFDKFINKDGCGLSLIHGAPGCGKTTYIKNLIYNYGENKQFFILDSSLLGCITQQGFVDFLARNTNSIYILEDCETLLKDRNNVDNPWIGTLLNLTDGMLGESLKNKFICTFNCELSSIDKALLREGRLDILYEFKPLNVVKSKALCKEIGTPFKGRPMTLAEIYKSKFDSSKINKQPNKIGF